MDNKIANELIKIAKNIISADRSDSYFRSLEEALGAIRNIPIEYAWGLRNKKSYEMAKIRKEIVKLLEKMISEYPIGVTYKVVYGMKEKPFMTENPAKLIQYMKSKGHGLQGYTGSAHHKELENQPKFKGILGPMYDGAKMVRYETQSVYDVLSQ